MGWAGDYETIIVGNHLSSEILPEKGEDSYPYIQAWLADTPYSASQMFWVSKLYRFFHSYRHNLALVVILLLCESSLLQVLKSTRMIWYPYVFYEGLFFSESFERAILIQLRQIFPECLCHCICQIIR
jgi:hypothetical protein